MPILRLNRSTVVNALYCAADKFDANAKELAEIPNHGRVAEQFKRQAVEARKIAEQIEQADTIELED